jgi:peroxiredoxin Q/BCP
MRNNLSTEPLHMSHKMQKAVLYCAMLVAQTGSAIDASVPDAVAPNFTLRSQDNSPVSLTDYKGKWVVLFFYSKDQSPEASEEANSFQRDLSKFEALNAVVLGISSDTAESHKTWCKKDGFGFNLLSDPD